MLIRQRQTMRTCSTGLGRLPAKQELHRVRTAPLGLFPSAGHGFPVLGECESCCPFFVIRRLQVREDELSCFWIGGTVFDGPLLTGVLLQEAADLRSIPSRKCNKDIQAEVTLSPPS